MPQVSVIIPTYKHSGFVLATLDSVFAQTFTDYEVIVVNDGSPDDTADVLRPLAQAGRIRYVEQENRGQGAARNRGIAEAQGEFIALLDDDDLWPPGKLEWQTKALRENPQAVLVYGRVSLVESDFSLSTSGEIQQDSATDDDPPSGFVLEEFLKQNWIHSPGQTLIRRESLTQINGFDESIWGADDYDLYIRLAALGTFVHKNCLGLYYRQHAHNASKNIRRMYKNICAVRQKHLGLVPSLRNYRLWTANYRFWHDLYLDKMIHGTRIAIHQKDKIEARAMWIDAFRMPPRLSHSRYMLYLMRQLW